jgi:uncharacterized protein (TIGR02099 family)
MLRWLLGTAATLLILLAVLVGVARLLLPAVPEYRNEIRKFAVAATGFDLQFASVQASWPLRGPALQFSGVRIATLDTRRPVIDVGELEVGLNLWRLLVDRRLQPGFVAVDNARLSLTRGGDGRWFANGVAVEELLRQRRDQAAPRVDLELRRLEVDWRDPARLEPRVRIVVEQAELEIDPETVVIATEISGLDRFAGLVELTGSLPTALFRPGVATGDAPDWALRVTGSELDLVPWLRLLANQEIPLRAARGDVDLDAAFVAGKLQSVRADLDLEAPRFSGVAEGDNDFRRLQLDAGWTATATGGRLVLEQLSAARGARGTTRSSGSVDWSAPADGPLRVVARADDLYLHDVWPLVQALASAPLRRDFLPAAVRGRVRELDLKLTAPAGRPAALEASARFSDLGLRMPEPGVAVEGLTGSVRATAAGGSVLLEAGPGLIRFPALFRADIVTRELLGRVDWQQTERGLEFRSDNLRAATADALGEGRVRVVLPPAAPVFVDIDARFSATSAPAGLNYLPLKRFKPNVVQWLDRALVAGKVPSAALRWQGPLRGLPYLETPGLFRAEFTLAEATIDYADGWPRLEDTTGTVVIDRATLTSLENNGSVGGMPFSNAEIRIPRLGQGAELRVRADSQVGPQQILDFLRDSPIRAALGPGLDPVTAAGSVAADIDLVVPFDSPREFRLGGTLTLKDTRLGLTGVSLGLTDLAGVVTLENSRLRATGLSARFLDEPVTLALRPGANQAVVAQVFSVQGQTPVDKLETAFALPYAAKLAGQVAWQADALFPARGGRQPLRVRVDADLEATNSTLAAPLAKRAGDPERLRMEVRVPDRNRIQLQGQLERDVSFALQFEPRRPQGWRLERGALRTGAALAALPTEPGLTIAGRVDRVRYEDWFDAAPTGAVSSGTGGPREIELTAGTFAIFGQLFRDVRVAARRGERSWSVDVEGPSTRGRIAVPLATTPEEPLDLDMERLWLVETDPQAGDGRADPRRLPPVRARIRDFALNELKLGELKADLAQRGDGIVVEPLTTRAADFRLEGDATWVVEDDDVARQRSELRLRLSSTNARSTLVALGYEPVVEAEKAELTLDLFWPGGPSATFLNIAGGRIAADVRKGRFLAVDPGSGRLAGLLSLTSIPRRLALDFSDVTDEGLAFDSVKGEFRLDAGRGFTCNFGLEGPVTDLAIVGQLDFRARTYDQLAVVRPHVSDMLTVGSFVGGPVIGGTVLLISQIFRKPLSSLGESYYRVSGSWDKPAVLKMQRSEVDVTPFKDCERYLVEALRELPPEAEVER